MKCLRYTNALFVLCLLSFAVLQAADSTMVYANQLNHYYIFGGWNRFAADYGRFRVQSKIQNNSSVYSETSRLKTQTDLSTAVLYGFSEQWSAGISGKYFIFRDAQTHHAYDYDQSRLGLKSEYRPANYSLSLESGYARETRLGIRDRGWYGGVELSRKDAGLQFYPELDWDYSGMGKRRNYTFDNHIRYHTKIDKVFHNDLKSGFRAYQREYYISQDAETEERQNLNAYVENDFFYRFHENMALDYNMEFTAGSDGLEFNHAGDKTTRTREVLGFRNDARLRGKLGPFRGYIGFSNDFKQSRTHSDNPAVNLPADYTFDKKNILMRISWQLSENDSLSVNYIGSLLYYDTPDTNNYDDRDELSYSLTPAWQRRLDEYTSLTVSGNMFLHHYVYLFHQRSAQNHWNRVFSIRSDISTHIPERIRWNARQEIYANYFVYDHEDSAFVHVQSMVFRGIHLQQNLQWFAGNRFFIQMNALLRVEDNGLLDWDVFVQERTDSKYTLKLELLPGYRLRKSSLSAGPVFTYRRDFRYISQEERMESYRSRRLGGSISLRVAHYLVLNYRLEHIRQNTVDDYYNQSGSLRFNLIF
jgi:hypothetical protein